MNESALAILAVMVFVLSLVAIIKANEAVQRSDRLRSYFALTDEQLEHDQRCQKAALEFAPDNDPGTEFGDFPNLSAETVKQSAPKRRPAAKKKASRRA